VNSERPPRLEVFKALGDNTRYAIYLELVRAPAPLSTAEIAATLGLHVNTVRPHLERMREAGLLEVEVDGRGGVGRPQHRHRLAADAPSLGLEPPVFPLATRMLLRLAVSAGLGADEAVEAGRDQGLADGRPVADPAAGVEAVQRRLADLGFDPTPVPTDEGVTLAFGHCPFRELAETDPALVCGLHQGLVEGLVEGTGTGASCRFRTLVDRDPCQVDVLVGALSSAVEPS
jgi:predicted ArsR family transcriptional regulator